MHNTYHQDNLGLVSEMPRRQPADGLLHKLISVTALISFFFLGCGSSACTALMRHRGVLWSCNPGRADPAEADLSAHCVMIVATNSLAIDSSVLL